MKEAPVYEKIEIKEEERIETNEPEQTFSVLRNAGKENEFVGEIENMSSTSFRGKSLKQD